MFLYILFVLCLSYSVSSFNYPLTVDTLMKINLKSNRLSARCSTQMGEYISGLVNEMEWAWNLFDASTKLPYGILTGNILELGNFDQCVVIEHAIQNGDKILGKYFLAGVALFVPLNLNNGTEFQHSNTQVTQKWLPSPYDSPLLNTARGFEAAETEVTTVLLSICLPDACVPSEVLAAVFEVTGDIPLLYANDENGETINDTPDFTGSDIAFVTFFAVIICLNIVCSIYDIYLQRTGRKPPHQLLIAFAGYSHVKKLLQNSNNSNRIACLDGLRVFSIFWVVLGHRYSVSQALPYVNYDYLHEWKLRTYSQFAQGAGLAVDSFLFLTGLLTAMQFMKSQSRPNARFNIILYYIHRYLRLTPALAVVYFLQVSVAIHFGAGPLWSTLLGASRERCLDMALPFFLYYQNYMDSNSMCLIHSWYLSMDMQIFILSPIVLIPLVKFKKYMIRYGLPILLAASIITAFVIVYVYETVILSQEYYDYYYYPTHTRLSAYLVGTLAGALMYEYRDMKLNIHWITNLGIWIIVIVGMAACLFTGNQVTYDFDRLSNAFYLALHRPMWCVGLAWVVFACMKGRGGIFDWVLSRDMFQTLGKVSYSMYLVHVTLLLWNVARIRYPGRFHDLDILHQFFGDLTTVIPAGFLWCVLFESPVVILEKVIFGDGGGRGPRKAEPSKSEEAPIDVKVQPDK